MEAATVAFLGLGCIPGCDDMRAILPPQADFLAQQILGQAKRRIQE